MANPENDPNIEQRVRIVIDWLERWGHTPQPFGEVVGRERTHDDDVRDQAFNWGMSEGYDNVLDRLYWVLGEER